MRRACYRLSIILLLFFVNSCNKEDEKACSKQYLESKSDLKIAFTKSHTQLNDTTEIEDKLRRFLSSFGDKTCEENGVEINHYSEAKNLLNEIQFETAEPTKLMPKVVYGSDNRLDIEDVTNSKFLEFARSVAMQIDNRKISEDGNLISETLGVRNNLCTGERFINQKAAGSCSGFLVGPKTLVTAGHCITSQRDCDSYSWGFGVTRDSSNVEPSNRFSCVSITEQVLDQASGLDYAIIELDREVSGRSALKFRASGEVKQGAPLVVIGHPSGLPMKVSDGANVRSSSEETYFTANLDSFAGNSGSPVINVQTSTVEGILVRGEQDYELVERGDIYCNIVKVCATNACRGEDVTRITMLDGLVSNVVASEEDVFEQVFSAAPQFVESDSHSFIFSRYQSSGFSVSGKSFLGVCVAHVFFDDEPDEWEFKTEFNCEDKSEFTALYDYFIQVME